MTDTSTAIAAAPLVALAAPYIVAVAGVVVPALVAAGLAELRKLTGLRVQEAATDKIDALIEDKVGQLVAAASDNLATKAIPIGSPLVASIAMEIAAAAPGALAKAGIDPASVADMVHGEIGKWQAGMTTVSVAKA
ncbi:MAG TPA: hypothetical protein VEF90_17860 [Xanthobacteraceae bacterium]|nr:hypothetical protein [Xanthobacteraceae bacterium]